MKPTIIKKKDKYYFVDKKGRKWDSDHIQEIMDAYNHYSKFKEIMNYYNC
jgi:hypothetical protein